MLVARMHKAARTAVETQWDALGQPARGATEPARPVRGERRSDAQQGTPRDAGMPQHAPARVKRDAQSQW